jgi:hypothetical protein
VPSNKHKGNAKAMNNKTYRVTVNRVNNKAVSSKADNNRVVNGQQQQGGQQQSGQQGGLNAGSQYGPTGGRDYGMNQESLQGAINDLNSWRGKIDPHDRQLRVAVDDTLGYLRLLHADPNRLQSTIGQDAVSRLERLEVELARRTGELQQLEGARLRAPEDSPEKYRDAVAEYFRKLSQAKISLLEMILPHEFGKSLHTDPMR